jgi:peptide subunit release factor RF-3
LSALRVLMARFACLIQTVEPKPKLLAPGISIVCHSVLQQDGQDRRFFQQCLDDIKERLGARPVPIQLPIGSEAEFKGIIDLVRMKAVIWENEALGANYHDEEIPAGMLDAANQARADMIEACGELDDQATEDFLNGKKF